MPFVWAGPPRRKEKITTTDPLPLHIDYGIPRLFLQCLTHNPPALEPCAPPPAKPEALPGARSPGHGGMGRFWQIFQAAGLWGKCPCGRRPVCRQAGRRRAWVRCAGQAACGATGLPPNGRQAFKISLKTGLKKVYLCGMLYTNSHKNSRV